MTQFGDPKNRNNSEPRPIGDILNELKSVPQFQGGEYIDTGVRAVITAYQNLNSSHSKYAIAGVKLRMGEGTLSDQLARLQPNDSARGAIADLLITIHQTHRSMETAASGNFSALKEELCDYLVHPGLPEDRRYFARELLLMHSIRHSADQEMRDYMRLAECLVALARPLKTTEGQWTLDSLRTLTLYSDLWVATFENLASIRGSNTTFVLPILKENFKLVQYEDWFCEWFTEELVDNNRWAHKIHKALPPPPDTQKNTQQPYDEPDIDASDL